MQQSQLSFQAARPRLAEQVGAIRLKVEHDMLNSILIATGDTRECGLGASWGDGQWTPCVDVCVFCVCACARAVWSRTSTLTGVHAMGRRVQSVNAESYVCLQAPLADRSPTHSMIHDSLFMGTCCARGRRF